MRVSYSCTFYISILLYVVLAATPSTVAAQPKQGQARVDSLLAEVQNIKEDTNGVKLLKDISRSYYTINPAEGLKWAEKELALARKIGWRMGEAKAYNDFGNNYRNMGSYAQALDAYYKGLRIFESLGDKKGIGLLNSNIGSIYALQKAYAKGRQYFFTSLRMAEERKDKRDMHFALGNIGASYVEEGNAAKGVEYEKQALKIAEELNDRPNMILQIGNIGTAYSHLKQYNLAISYFSKALRMAEEIGEKQLEALNLGNIGTVYHDVYRDSTLPVADSLIPSGKAANLANAIKYLERAIIASKESNGLESIRIFSETRLCRAWRL